MCTIFKSLEGIKNKFAFNLYILRTVEDFHPFVNVEVYRSSGANEKHVQ